MDISVILAVETRNVHGLARRNANYSIRNVYMPRTFDGIQDRTYGEETDGVVGDERRFGNGKAKGLSIPPQCATQLDP